MTLPLALPGIIAGMVLCFAKALGEFGATITFVSNIPGETQTISAAIYTYTQVPGGDAAALRLVVVAIVIVARRAGRLRMVRAPRRHALPRGLTMLAVDVEKRLGDFTLAARFEAHGRRDRAVRPVRRRQDHDRQHDRGPGRRPTAAASRSTARCCSIPPRASNVPPHRRRIGYVFQEGRLFPHLTVAQNLDYGRWMRGLPRDAAERERVVDAARHRRIC